MIIREVLRQVLMVEPGIDRAGQADDPLLEGFGGPVGGPAPPVAMGHTGRTVSPEPGEEATAMSQRQAQEVGAFRRRHPPLTDRRQHHCPPLLFLGQGNRLPGHEARVTDSLFSYRVTLSLFIHTDGSGS
jgi:hypothetical protein